MPLPEFIVIALVVSARDSVMVFGCRRSFGFGHMSAILRKDPLGCSRRGSDFRRFKGESEKHRQLTVVSRPARIGLHKQIDRTATGNSGAGIDDKRD